jgi:glyoxylase-like metal-dependent hydrolase (beta-lactamase superfamily II)
MRIEILDLDFGQTPETIASFLVFGSEGPVLVETGPASTLPVLLARLAEHDVAPEDVRHVLVTHIHLDHAGAAGWWAQQGATVYVHPNGAQHLIDPSKLLRSAERIYKERMAELWGQTLPAPVDNIVAVEGGSTIEAAGLSFTALDTPGHARHHHVYRLGDVAFTGDAAGVRLGERHWIDLPAPPPEFDLEAWKQTLSRLRRENFTTIYRTHFGATSDVAAQLDRFETHLEEGAELVRHLMTEGLERDGMIARYNQTMWRLASADGVDDQTALAYELANPRFMSVDGIARYWRKRAEQGAT